MLPIKCSVEFKTHLDKLSELPLYSGCKTSVEGLQNRILKSREGLLLEGDVEGDVKEGVSGEGGVGVGEDEL